jgi:hypothetical protein
MPAVLLVLIVGTILLIGPNANKVFSNTLARFIWSRTSIGFGDDSRNRLVHNTFYRIQFSQVTLPE